jgi:hypothetical protein
MKNGTKKGLLKPAGLRLAYITPVFVVILLSIFGYLYFFGENHPSYRKFITSVPETQLGQLTSRNAKLRADIEELKGVKDLVAGLENELAERDQTISSLKKRLSHIATELDQEKKSKELVGSEEQDESPKPSNIIDYVLKKKAK